MTSQQARVDDKSSWPHFCVRQRRLREKRTWLNKKNSHPAGRSRICPSVDGKHLKADCGFGLDHSKKHFYSDAQMPRSVKTAPAVLTDRVPVFFVEPKSCFHAGDFVARWSAIASVALCVWQCHLRNVSTLSNRTPNRYEWQPLRKR